MHCFALLADVAINPTDAWIQYGALGIVGFLVVWAVKWGFPKALATHEKICTDIAKEHKEAVTRITEAYQEEAKACREERQQVLKYFAERDKGGDRE